MPKVGMMVCPLCGGDSGVALAKCLNKEIPDRIADINPCDNCLNLMKKGVVLVEVDGDKRTGRVWVLKKEAVRRMGLEEAADKRAAFISPEAAEKLGLNTAEEKKFEESIDDLLLLDGPYGGVMGDVVYTEEYKGKVYHARKYVCTAGHDTFKIEYGWREGLNKRGPEFSVTGDWLHDNKCISSWAIGDHIAEYLPEFRKICRWHCCSLEGPMHYIANGLYQWKRYKGRSKWEVKFGETPLRSFASTIVFGAVPGDAEKIKQVDTDEEVKQWLEARLPRLLKTLEEDGRAYGLLE